MVGQRGPRHSPTVGDISARPTLRHLGDQLHATGSQIVSGADDFHPACGDRLGDGGVHRLEFFDAEGDVGANRVFEFVAFFMLFSQQSGPATRRTNRERCKCTTAFAGGR